MVTLMARHVVLVVQNSFVIMVLTLRCATLTCESELRKRCFKFMTW